MRNSSVFLRDNLTSLPVVSKAQGYYLWDTSGKQHLDASGGAAISSLGHGDPQILEAIHKQLDSCAFAHTAFFTSEPAESLAKILCKQAPKNIEYVYYTCGGSEAIETAIKLARQYSVESGKESKSRIIARRQSYHGNTLGALSAGGNMMRRKLYEPLLCEMSHIAPCYAFRDRSENETLYEYGQRVAKDLETEILNIGADKTLAFIAEPVVGATLGAVPAVEGYFKTIREICTKYDVLLILDEVMCGMGRTGSMFASIQEDIEPDMICIAKGLGAGYQPIGATLCTKKIYDTITQGTGAFQHGHSYNGHNTACAAGLAVQKVIEERNLLANVEKMSEALFAELSRNFGQHPHVGDIRGKGLFIGLELVANREDNQPFPSANKVYKRIKNLASEEGLICYPMGGTIDGISGDHILLAPPFIIDDKFIDELISKLSNIFKRL